ncbi:MAG TPA: aminoglycoside phosphotransferase family protein [Acidimicrobiales bacterium]|nr:aminoglycoside phosphotransferase family protein [Acidimicrobiales bacterium]
MIDDPLLPAARHLFGDDAEDLVRVAVAHVGGELVELQPVQVQHRPGADLVVRYEAQVAWHGAPPRPETLLAAATTEGAPPGSLPLEADGLAAGVWRYPFDPVLTALQAAVTPEPGEHLEVVAYRPTRRAVVRRVDAAGATTYRKVVRPREAARLVRVHERLRAAGLPVPRVLHADVDTGLIELEALGGDNLRDRFVDDRTGWPPVHQLVELMAALAEVDLDGDGRPGGLGVGDATAAHAGALLAILPEERTRLGRIVDAVADIERPGPAHARTIHGDLYEAQIMVTDGSVSGLLDLDDVRLGDPLDDAAVMIGHLHLVRPADVAHRAKLGRYRRRLRDALAEAFAPGGDRAELDRRTAGVLVGLATGPFRAQTHAWRTEVRRRLALADRLVRTASRDEEILRIAS